jgi:hypothetical protein
MFFASCISLAQCLVVFVTRVSALAPKVTPHPDPRHIARRLGARGDAAVVDANTLSRVLGFASLSNGTCRSKSSCRFDTYLT